jgi:hypothetical protein
MKYVVADGMEISTVKSRAGLTLIEVVEMKYPSEVPNTPENPGLLNDSLVAVPTRNQFPPSHDDRAVPGKVVE